VLSAAVRTGVDYLDVEYDNYKVRGNQQQNIACDGDRGEHAYDFFQRITSRRSSRIYAGCIMRLNTLRQGDTENCLFGPSYNDCFELLDLLHEFGEGLIAFCMDEAGFITRIIAKKTGAFCSFASITERRRRRPASDDKANERCLPVGFDNARTELYGVIGSPVAHSLSPMVHNACFADAGLNKLFLPLLVTGEQAEFNTFYG